MKILVLHGYGQTPKSNSNLAKAFRGCDLISLEGPHQVINQKGEPGRAWWIPREEPLLESTEYIGIEESIEKVKRELPCDGIIGFSQGGAFTSLLAGMFEFKFCIIIGGFPALDPKYTHLYERVSGKVLHVLGEEDSIVNPELSEKLFELCGKEKKLVRHPGKHVIPNLKDEYRWVLQ